MQQAWTAGPYNNDIVLFMNADDLARKFRSSIQAQPDLIDWGINSDWIEDNFTLFCRSLGGRIQAPPDYTKFAHQLAKVMKRGRRDVWGKGVRIGTITAYWVPDPAATVVDRAAERREAS